MLQRFLNRTLKAWWIAPASIACIVIGLVDDSRWWLATVGAVGFLPLACAVHLQDRERKLAEQRQRKKGAKRTEPPR